MKVRAIDQLTDRDRQVIWELKEAIERNGHFQGEKPSAGTTCLVVNSPLNCTGSLTAHRILEAIQEAAGVDGESSSVIITHWNDAVPTDEVLDVLAGLAVG